ncbi:Relaxase/Mobilisation nuclease domain-containing protein [Aquiflexum balticum DSM 16537]|uniref:Relaxase/Mobilisation nuclease domain-containing protein n=1 Tax=Aquiflexum balticum DSM 16537 TaxID=758820 RepID=A0A1W2H897_9BACT|nr:relaxase/mobilization nuclease domain-containing protein [Aquiflexum balticum]SMD44848.1 Relaxase/Mobilisation nuclease domain-containing protein [Aquiflexum balticum DSM 16537]
MVAVIKSGNSLRRPFHYNENKVAEGVANRILAENFPISPEQLSPENSLRFLSKQASQNDRSKVNAVHISLNFSPDEKLEPETLKEISRGYMDGIGFGNQPYMVYQHHDAGHPHLHIVTTNIQLDGKRIPLHNIGKTKSEPVRKSIEKQFGLVRAEDQKRQLYIPDPIHVRQAEYGKSETKKAIGNVLQHVLNNYKFTSLPELNAVLKCYNITADRGSEESRVFKHKGLYYRVLDSDGTKVGVPIKASLFAFKATLPFIESKFVGNELARQKHAQDLKSVIDMSLIRTDIKGLSELKEALDKKGISLVIRQNQEGRIFGITYVDHRNRTVFNGSALGKKYAAKGLKEALGVGHSPTLMATVDKQKNDLTSNPSKSQNEKNADELPLNMTRSDGSESGLLETLMGPESSYSYVPFDWKKRKKKKKKGIKKP